MKRGTQEIEFAAMRGRVSCKSAIRKCDEINGRPVAPNERRDLRLTELEVESRINKLRAARAAAGLPKSIWARMDENVRSAPKLRIENSYAGDYKLFVYGPIGSRHDGISAESFIRELDRIPSHEDVTVHLNSEGGGYYEGLAIHDAILKRGNVDVVIDSLAASAGSFIAMAGRMVTISEHAWLMIHCVHGVVEGEAEDLRDTAELFDRIDESLVSIYMRRWSGSEASLREALAAETWFNAREAVAVGLADSVSAPSSIAARVVDPTKWKYDKVPSVLQIAACAERVSPATYRAKFKLYEMEFDEALGN